MAHHHHHHGHDHHHHHHDGADTGGLRTAFFLNISFTLLEIVGGVWTNSVAILSDAIHDLGDSLSLGTAWYLQRLSQRGRTATYTYGYKRFSLLGAIITSLVLVVGSTVMLYEAVPRLFRPEAAYAPGMIGLAIVGVLVNGVAVLRTRKGRSLNEQVVSWHLLEDVLGWAAVLIGALMMYWFDLPVIDPLLSIGITVFIMINVVRRLIRVVRIILQAAPEEIDTEAIKARLEEVADVRDVHHTHLWSMDGEYNVVTLHVRVAGNTTVTDLQPIKRNIRHSLHDLGVEHATVEFEAAEEECDCKEC